MNILVVDDDPAVRQLIRRFLTHDFDVEVQEADDGLAALDRLLTGRVDLVLLDLSMPVMDGLETLEAIRRSRTYQAVPVVVLTGHAEETQMRRAMDLGIASVILKPFTRTLLHERLSAIMSMIPAPNRDVATGPIKLEITPDHRLLIVDRNQEFRATAARLLQKLCQVDEVDSQAAAIAHCATTPCNFMLIGATGEETGADAFARSVRSHADLAAIKLLGAVPPEERTASRSRGAFDAMLPRSFVPESFEYGLRQVLSETTLARFLLHQTSPFVANWFESVRLHVGRLLRSDIRMHERTPFLRNEARWIVASSSIQSASGVWLLVLRCPVSVALQLGRACFDGDTDQVSQGEIINAVGTVVKGFGRRLRTELLECGLTIEVSDGRVSVEPVDVPPRAADAAGTRRWFLTPHQETVVMELVPAGTLPVVPVA